MDTPVRAFWMLTAQVSRLRAEEALNTMDLMFVANMNCSGEHITELRETYLKTLGEPVTVKKTPQVSAEEHKEGIAKLKQLLGG